MGLFKKKEERADAIEAVTPSVSSDILKSVLNDKEVTREKALSIPTVKSCINVISGTVASLPIKLYRQENKDGKKLVTEITDDVRLMLLNHDTKDTLTATQFWKAMIEDYYIGKGGYAYINKRYTDYTSLNYVENDKISFQEGTDPIFKDYKINVYGKAYEPFEFFKILRNTKDGCKSISITEENQTILSVAYSSLNFEDALVKKGGNKKGFLEYDGVAGLTQEALTKLKNAFKKMYGNNEENVVVLNKGMKFQESSNSCVEMQLNENKETNSVEIAMIFNVPISIIRGKATREDKDNFIDYCIVPLLNDIEASLDRDLLTEQEKEQGFYFAFDTKELTRGNILDRYKAYELAYQNNFMQIDEIREKEDLEPIGFNFIKLGLDSVLYNPKTGEIYVANTNKTTSMDNLKRGGEVDENGVES